MSERNQVVVARPSESLLTGQDLYLFNEGSHYRLYQKLGAHPRTVDEVAGTSFAVWAPGAHQVFVMGDFNGWDKGKHPLRVREHSGIWEGFVPGVCPGAGRLPPAHGVHPRRVPAADGAPVLRLVGLPDDRLLRPDQPLRHAAGPDVPDRLPAPARHRGDPRLGAVALPRRPARA